MNIRKSIPKTVHAMVCAFSEIRKADVIPPIWWCRSVCLTFLRIFLSYRNLRKVYGLQIEGSYHISVILYFAYVAV